MFLFWMQHALAALPDDKTKITVLIDRTNAGVMNQDIEMMRSLNSIWQDNFPERIYRCIVHPTGMVFYGVNMQTLLYAMMNTTNCGMCKFISFLQRCGMLFKCFWILSLKKR